MKTRIHVNQHNIKANAKGAELPVITVKDYKQNRKANHAAVVDSEGMMDKIDLFVDHFVIYSESREALLLNSGTTSAFEESLRELVSSEIRDTLLERVNMLNYDMKLAEPNRHVSPQYDRLRDARTTLMSLHNDLLWNRENT